MLIHPFKKTPSYFNKMRRRFCVNMQVLFRVNQLVFPMTQEKMHENNGVLIFCDIANLLIKAIGGNVGVCIIIHVFLGEKWLF